MSKCALCKTSLKDDEINVCDKCRLDFLNFKQQLSEKDKEIEELKRDLQLEYAFTPVRGDGKTFTKLNVIQDFKNSIRKQVCDEIREYMAKEYGISVKDMPKRYHSLAWSVKDIYELLDQIEQGE